ncbi:hypothetical protein AXG89_41660 (plasmid) [Burkholderia sp. PAMC 26561]|nr:hypothetical protein AXG89_41660 [Burkholderia sp. PAMC 26561]
MEVQLAMNGIAKRATSALENCIWRLQKSESAIRVFLLSHRYWFIGIFRKYLRTLNAGTVYGPSPKVFDRSAVVQRLRQHIPTIDLVVQRLEAIPGFCLRFRV